MSDVQILPAVSAMTATDHFLHHMNAMKVHYTSGATHSYALPSHLVYPDVEEYGEVESAAFDDGSGADAVKEGVAAYKQTMQQIVSKASTGAKAGVDTLHKTKADANATNSFVEQMKKLETQQKKEADAAIHNNFQQLIKTGIAHPHRQKEILSLTQKIGAFFTALWEKVKTFFINLYHSVVNFFKDVGHWFKGAYETVKGWAEKAGHAIKHFFTHLF